MLYCLLWPGVDSVSVQLDKGLVIVTTVLPAVQVHELIEETGRKAVLFGVKATDGQCHSKCTVDVIVLCHAILIYNSASCCSVVVISFYVCFKINNAWIEVLADAVIVDAAESVPVSAAVAMVSGRQGQQGVVRFIATSGTSCLIDGTVDGLQPACRHALLIHEFGDMSDDCER